MFSCAVSMKRESASPVRSRERSAAGGVGGSQHSWRFHSSESTQQETKIVGQEAADANPSISGYVPCDAGVFIGSKHRPILSALSLTRCGSSTLVVL